VQGSYPVAGASAPYEATTNVGRRNESLLILFTATTNLSDAIVRVALPLVTLQITQSPAVVTAVATD
jgi:hypothetical protein